MKGQSEFATVTWASDGQGDWEGSMNKPCAIFVCHFLVINSNLGHISHRFRDMASFPLKTHIFQSINQSSLFQTETSIEHRQNNKSNKSNKSGKKKQK